MILKFEEKLTYPAYFFGKVDKRAYFYPNFSNTLVIGTDKRV